MNESGPGADGAARGPGDGDAPPPTGLAAGSSPGETAGTAPPSPPRSSFAPAGGPEHPPELVRDNERGLATGVCAGLGAYTGIDPIVWRVGFAITGLAGFTGVLLYVGAWMAMRDAGRGPAMFEQLLNRRIDDRAVPALLGLGVALGVALSLIGGVSWGTLMLATPLILGALVAHNRGVDLRAAYRELPRLLRSAEPPPSTPPPAPKPAYYNPAQPWAQAPSGPVDLAVVSDPDRDGAADADGTGGAAGADGADAGTQGASGKGSLHGGDDCGDAGRPGPRSAKARLRSAQERREGARERRRSRRVRRRDRRRARGFRLLGIVWWAVVAAAAITVAATPTPFVEALLGPQTGPTFLGSVVVIVGIAAVAGAWVGDPRGLITVGTVASLLLVCSAAVDASNLRFGSLNWRPESVAAAGRPHELTGGEARLDLTRVPLEPGQRVRVGAEVGFGTLTVLVPKDARVEVRSRASGEVRTPDAVRWGIGLDVRETIEPDPAAAARGSDARGGGAGGGAAASSGEVRQGGKDERGGPPTLVVDLASQFGDLEVRHAAT
ncbi:PspC domain-containing protein [Streptomonospora wellingtoniae]|uniref:PspC domain-containing protein n=1 Tax=Streptomonospora wellingtoniae TaxID=3075544 RepID=A0ABU2KYP0_9ACTN|nr:PspC domain-containing protein [Streptomonospora sp. DSM 45055]MDT0304424.1 PspC domain-containing protein [Streptomonospora sp. DSM 45055]